MSKKKEQLGQGLRALLSNIDKIESILTITRLISVFEHHDSRELALKAFAG